MKLSFIFLAISFLWHAHAMATMNKSCLSSRIEVLKNSREYKLNKKFRTNVKLKRSFSKLEILDTVPAFVKKELANLNITEISGRRIRKEHLSKLPMIFTKAFKENGSPGSLSYDELLMTLKSLAFDSLKKRAGQRVMLSQGSSYVKLLMKTLRKKQYNHLVYENPFVKNEVLLKDIYKKHFVYIERKLVKDLIFDKGIFSELSQLGENGVFKFRHNSLNYVLEVFPEEKTFLIKTMDDNGDILERGMLEGLTSFEKMNNFGILTGSRRYRSYEIENQRFSRGENINMKLLKILSPYLSDQSKNLIMRENLDLVDYMVNTRLRVGEL